MAVTIVPFAAEHVRVLKDLVPEQEAALILAHPNVLRYRAVFDGDTCVGVVGLKLVGEHPEVVVATLPGQRQKRYATAAVTEMVRYAFEVVGVQAVYASCLMERPSNKVAAKTGFTCVAEQGRERFYELRKADWQAAQHQPAAIVAEPVEKAVEAPTEKPAGGDAPK